MFVGENVVGFAASKGIGPSDLEIMTGRLAEKRYTLVDFRVKAEQFGSPSPRDRPPRKFRVGCLMQHLVVPFAFKFETHQCKFSRSDNHHILHS
jgi:hypothetical protein